MIFDALKAGESITVSDDEIKAYYDKNTQLFKTPKQVNVAYVNFTFPANATDADKTQAQSKAENLAKALKSGKDFATAAKESNQEVKESGFFSEEAPLLTFAWSPEWVKDIFKMRKGQVGKPKLMPDGWQVIQIKDIQNAGITPFENAKAQAKDNVLTAKGYEIATAQATKALEQIKAAIAKDKTVDFNKAATDSGFTVEHLPGFSRGEPTQGFATEFQTASLQMTKDTPLSEIVNTSKGPAIAYLNSAEPLKDVAFGAQKDNFRQMMESRKQTEAIQNFVNQLREKANVQIMLKNK